MLLPAEWVPERWSHQDMLLIGLDESALALDKLGLFLRVLNYETIAAYTDLSVEEVQQMAKKVS